MPHPAVPIGCGTKATYFFENGYGVSVVRFRSPLGYNSYTSNESEWELAVLKGKSNDYELCYDTPITDDVIGHLSETEVTEVMTKVQQLPALVNLIN